MNLEKLKPEIGLWRPLPLFGVICLVVSVQTSVAQQPTPQPAVRWPACQSEGSLNQMAMTACAYQHEQLANERMEKSYEAVACHFDDEEKAKLAAVQQAWSAFRDADCRRWSGLDVSAMGSIKPMVEHECRARLAEARTAELDRWPYYGASREPCR
jgi:uncharacterized protein YecT (DUF1311 family)